MHYPIYLSRDSSHIYLQQTELTYAWNISQLFFIAQHVAAQSVHNGFYLEFFYFVHKGAQAKII